MEISKIPPIKSILTGVSKKRSATFNPATATRAIQTDTDHDGLDYKNSYNELVVLYEELMKKYEGIKNELEVTKSDLFDSKHRLSSLPFAYRDSYTRAATENRELTKKL